MKKTALYLLALPIMFGACTSKCVEDLGIRTTQDYKVEPYDEIKVSGPVKLILRQDSSFNIEVQSDSSASGLVKAKVSGHELEIKLNSEKYCGRDSVIVTAGIGALKKIEASEAVRVYSSSLITVNELELKLSGATQIKMELNAAKLITNADGASRINLIGQAGTHELKSKGALDLDSYAFVAGIYRLDLEGVAKAKINVLNDLRIKSTGAATISYKGTPKNLEEKKTGTYKLEKVN